MKARFTPLDTTAVRIELHKIVNARVIQIYDIDNKTYLIKLNAEDTSKVTLLLEAGIRVHTTQRDLSEIAKPSRFTRKLRQHIRNKRIVKVEQLGVDRILDIQFGSGKAAYHLILELFKRGNIFLTQHEYSIISRLYSDAESHHYATREQYPVNQARQRTRVSLEDIESLLKSCKKNERLRKAILPCIDFGDSFLEHCLSRVGLGPELKVPGPSFVETIRDKLVQLVDQLATGDAIIEEMQKNGPKGYISILVVDRDKDGEEINMMFDFNPYPFAHSAAFLTQTFDSFMEAVDEYFSLIGSQKLESKHVKKGNEAMRRIYEIKTDQASRLQELSEKQLADKIKAGLILNNAHTVEQALNRMRSFFAAQMSWDFIEDIIEMAKKKGDPIFSLITKTKFEINTISMLLSDPFAETKEGGVRVEVDLDLSLSAHANAERYYDPKKHAVVKEKITLEALKGALKSAEKEAREVVETVNPRRIPQNEKEAMRRVIIFKSDQASRHQELCDKQLADKIKADLIINNAHTVEQALNRIRSFFAGQMSWDFVEDIIEAAKKKGDPIFSLITKTNFEINTISMLLSDPFAETKEGGVRVEVDLDLSLSAHANAERYYDPKKHAAVKEKTLEFQKEALKSAEEEAREVVETVNPRRIPQNEHEATRRVIIFKSVEESRLQELSEKQLADKIKADLIINNAHTVEQALNRIRSFIAGYMSWDFIEDIVEAAKNKGDPICSLITKIKLESNTISMLLSDPFAETEEEVVRVEVDLDLSLSAHANADRYYDPKKNAAAKEKITLESRKGALKSAEKDAPEVVETVDPGRIPQHEKEAKRRVIIFKSDQEPRHQELCDKQLADKIKADLIINNAHIVEQALNRIRSFFAGQMSWDFVEDIIEAAKKKGNPIFSLITETKFDINTISMLLSDPFAETKEGGVRVEVDLDLSLSAHANAERYYDPKKHAAVKEKTLESQKEAMKSAEEEAREIVETVNPRRIPQNEYEATRRVIIFKSVEESRLQELSEKQLADKIKADLIINNAHTVEQALNRIRSFMAGHMSWDFIEDIVEAAKKKGDPICSLIIKIKLESNTISMLLSDPFAETEEEVVQVEVDLDLSLSAHANADRYYDPKKNAAAKEKITLESRKGALKSAEKDAPEVVETVDPGRIPQNENEVMRMKTDQASRLQELSEKQLADTIKADLIMHNAHTVEQALNRMRSFFAAQMPWDVIQDIIEASKKKGDPIVSLITKTEFEINTISMLLSDPFAETKEGGVRVEVDLDLSLSAHANAERYYDRKQLAAVKEKITLESLKEALKSVEKDVREVVETVDTQKAITVARKVFWFEKFYWFVSSDNCLVIGGRDQKQNELIVNHYMKMGDLYVQAEESGASSVVIKNPEGTPVSLRTIHEAGQMAVCYSQAWEWKDFSHAWWVYAHQVTKSAPTGEYFATGSFIIRGQKNYIPPIHLLLQLGFSFLFKIDESSVFRHRDERKLPPAGSVPGEVEVGEELEVEQLKTVLEKADEDDVSTATGMERETGITDLRFVYSAMSKAGIEREACKIGLHSVGSTEATTMDGGGIRTESHFDCTETTDIDRESNKTESDYDSTQTSDIDRESIQTESLSDSTETSEDETERVAYQMESSSDSSETEIEREEGQTQFLHSGSSVVRLPASSPVPPSNTSAPVSPPERKSPSPQKPSTSQQSHTPESHCFVHSFRLRTEIESSTPVLPSLQEASISSTAETKEKKTDVEKVVSLKRKEKGKFKRWLKSKLKKIKDKYRLDKEERELRMAVFQAAGSSGSGGGQTLRGEGGETGEEIEVQTELDMLPVLTGQPHPEDLLHFALPVVAPYSALLNHKFKVKLVPGMSEGGTAARSALEHFCQWKECGLAERDLLRAVPDQLLSRNFPSKVKLLFIQDEKK